MYSPTARGSIVPDVVGVDVAVVVVVVAVEVGVVGKQKAPPWLENWVMALLTAAVATLHMPEGALR